GVALLADFLTTWLELTVVLDVKREECVEPIAWLITEIGAVEWVCVHGTDTDGPPHTWVVAQHWMIWIRDLLGPELCTTIGSDSLRDLGSSGVLPLLETGRFAYGLLSLEQVSSYLLMTALTPQIVEAAQAAGVWVIASAFSD